LTFFHTSPLLTFSPNFPFFRKLAFTFIWMWYGQSNAMHLGKTMSTAFIRAWSHTVSMTFTSSWHRKKFRTSCVIPQFLT
jgi:hypothetical protein